MKGRPLFSSFRTLVARAERCLAERFTPQLGRDAARLDSSAISKGRTDPPAPCTTCGAGGGLVARQLLLSGGGRFFVAFLLLAGARARIQGEEGTMGGRRLSQNMNKPEQAPTLLPIFSCRATRSAGTLIAERSSGTTNLQSLYAQRAG